MFFVQRGDFYCRGPECSNAPPGLVLLAARDNCHSRTAKERRALRQPGATARRQQVRPRPGTVAAAGVGPTARSQVGRERGIARAPNQPGRRLVKHGRHGGRGNWVQACWTQLAVAVCHGSITGRAIVTVSLGQLNLFCGEHAGLWCWGYFARPSYFACARASTGGKLGSSGAGFHYSSRLRARAVRCARGCVGVHPCATGEQDDLYEASRLPGDETRQVQCPQLERRQCSVHTCACLYSCGARGVFGARAGAGGAAVNGVCSRRLEWFSGRWGWCR